MQGCIFDIERFSTADGPGIRTSVFFKGCNMKCAWCHNAEGISTRKELRFQPSLCAGCGQCFIVCTSGAHEMIDGKHGLDREKCVRCFECAWHCYSGALEVIGSLMDVDELERLVMEDEPFYRRSGGGVTLSGGEVMMQPDIARELLSRVRSRGVHTAIETNLSLPWNDYVKILPVVDLIMFDIKHMSNGAHMLGTGVGNGVILENAARLSRTGKEFITRTPIIPGYNDSDENIASTAEFLKGLPGLVYYELLSYNPLGEEKRAQLGKAGENHVYPQQDKARVLRLADIAASVGILTYLDGAPVK